MNAKRTITSLLLISMLASLASCGSEAPAGDDTTAAGGDTTTEPAVTEPAYDYAELDCEGGELHILSLPSTWNMYTYLDHESQTGEIIDDAVYDRNRMLEDKFNFKMKVTEVEIGDLDDEVTKTVTANDDVYDIAYIRGNSIASVVSNGYAKNLYDVPGLQLEQPWWNQSVIEEATIKKDGKEALYYALNEFSLCAFDLVWTIFFNEDMMTDLGQEMPYDLVREGKWTIDELKKQLKFGANLNGDSTFDFSYDRNAVYGLTSFYRLADAMIIGAGNKWTARDGESFKLNIENDRFYGTAEKLASLFGTDGDYVEANQDGVSYNKIFMADRALFYGGEVKASGVFREMESSFGILPLPKYDENQEQYYGWMNYDVPTMIIPVTNAELETTGILLDALSYHSYTDVLPKYYEIRVSQKSLRGDDSIEMLGIIRDSLCYDASLTYGWTQELAESIHNDLIRGNGDIASIIAQMKPSVDALIKTTVKNLG